MTIVIFSTPWCSSCSRRRPWARTSSPSSLRTSSSAPARPVWLSSDRRHVSDQPPVQTPAEVAAANGSKPSEVQDVTITAEQVLEEHPAAVVIEVPEGGHVDPSSD